MRTPVAARVGDPYVDPLFVNGRGFNRRSTPTGIASDVRIRRTRHAPGHSARIDCAHRLAGDGESAENVSDDIIFSSRSGANVLNKVIVDMADRNSLPLEPGSPSGWINGSTNKPGLDIFRVDPHEFDRADGLLHQAIKLAALEKTSASYTIRWTFSKPSGTVDLYWDDDSSGFDGTLIQNNVNASSGTVQLEREQHRDLHTHELLHLRDLSRRRRGGEQHESCLREVADRHRQHLSSAASSRAQPADAELRSRRPE